MADILLIHQAAIRLGAFASVFLGMALWELLWAPRRQQAVARLARWPSNLGIVALDTVLIRLVMPTAAVGTALLAGRNGWGLLQGREVPSWLALVASVILPDLARLIRNT